MIVIKYGGHVLDDKSTNESIIKEIASAHSSGKKIVVIHGGGPAINEELKIHGVESEMVAGYRKTTPEAMKVVQQTLSGSVLRELCNSFVAHGVNVVGLSASDGAIIRAEKFEPFVDGAKVDIGLVGEPTEINPSLIKLLLDSDYLPVISPIGVNSAGEPLNINGDIAAGAIAGALGADEVLFITDVPGIYRNWPDRTSLIKEISSVELESIAPTFAEGMAPKVKAVLSALNSGAEKARIIDGTDASNFAAAFNGLGGTVVLS